MQTSRIGLLFAGLLVGPLALGAQEPERHPVRERDFPRRAAPPGQTFEGRIQILMTRRAHIGISLDLRPREGDSVGALIASVTPNGPAARAGLRSGDVITSVNRQVITAPADGAREVSPAGLRLIELMSDVKPGDTLAVEFRRGTARRNASVIADQEPAIAWRTPDGGAGYAFGMENPAAAEAMRRYTLQLDGSPDRFEVEERPLRRDSMKVRVPMRMPPPMYTLTTPFADLQLAPMNPELGRYFGTGEGVLVINVPAGSRLGLRPGDVVLSVDGREPMGPAHLVRILRSYDGAEPFKLQVIRMKKREVVTAQVGE